MNQYSLFLKIALAICLLSHSLLAQENSPATANKITIDLVPVGDPNNEADIPEAQGGNGFGSVKIEYQIGKYDVTAEQYCAFLNAVASHSDPYLLYDERMTTDPDIACITRSGDEATGYTYQPMSDYCAKFPITYVSFFSALRFCNWLENGQPVGDETVGTTESGAYDCDAQGWFRSVVNSKWNLPTENQWYKAAYYQAAKNGNGAFYYNFGNSSYVPPNNSLKDADLPNEANYCLYGVFTTASQPRLTPVGTFTHSASPCGAYDMAGNVNQWTTAQLMMPVGGANMMVTRGGSWASIGHKDLGFLAAFFIEPNKRNSTLGFRVVYNEAAPKKKTASSWWWPW